MHDSVEHGLRYIDINVHHNTRQQCHLVKTVLYQYGHRQEKCQLITFDDVRRGKNHSLNFPPFPIPSQCFDNEAFAGMAG